MDWSYGLLAEREKMLFTALSLFGGGFTSDTAEDVFRRAGLKWTGVQAGVEALADHSLLRQEESEEARYRMLAVIRQYAAEGLPRRAEANRLGQAYIGYYLESAEEAVDLVWGEQQADRFAWFDRERDNLRAAQLLALDRGLAELSLRLGSALQPLWSARGQHSFTARYLARALELPGNVNEAAGTAALHAAGTARMFLGDYRAAEQLLRRALARRRETAMPRTSRAR